MTGEVQVRCVADQAQPNRYQSSDEILEKKVFEIIRFSAGATSQQPLNSPQFWQTLTEVNWSFFQRFYEGRICTTGPNGFGGLKLSSL